MDKNRGHNLARTSTMWEKETYTIEEWSSATKWGYIERYTKSQGLPMPEGHFGGVHPQALSGALVNQRQPD